MLGLWRDWVKMSRRGLEWSDWIWVCSGMRIVWMRRVRVICRLGECRRIRRGWGCRCRVRSRIWNRRFEKSRFQRSCIFQIKRLPEKRWSFWIRFKPRKSNWSILTSRKNCSNQLSNSRRNCKAKYKLKLIIENSVLFKTRSTVAWIALRINLKTKMLHS